MKALLMYCDRDFVSVEDVPHPDRHPRADPLEQLSRHERDVVQDLELNTLVRAMAGNDPFLVAVSFKAILSGLRNEVDTIQYRQAILSDCVNNAAVVRHLYDLAVQTIEGRRKHWWGITSNYPSSILHSSIDLMQMFMVMLRKLREVAEQHADGFRSEGFRALFATLQSELSDDYFAVVRTHLTDLKFRGGVLMSAELGPRDEGTCYVLREDVDRRPPWLKRIFRKGPPAYTFHLHPRDEAGGRILSGLCDRGVNRVANALAQSADHVLSFFEILRTELAFYVGCLNLRDKLTAMNAPVCLPEPQPVAARRQRFSGLYDVCLALTMNRAVVGNEHNADNKSLVIITGANQGGKSTFLRAVGVAQLMMQSGMFVGAASFSGEICRGLFTHYKREEDATMKSGKLDEELARMSAIADAITPNSLILFNESFGATNEREGSEIARQVVRAMLERRIKVFFVTHLYDFAHSFFERHMNDALFLRAERQPDGTRTFKLIEAEPLETSYGEDLYKEVFAAEAEEAIAG
jgi:MutS domain V